MRVTHFITITTVATLAAVSNGIQLEGDSAIAGLLQFAQADSTLQDRLAMAQLDSRSESDSDTGDASLKGTPTKVVADDKLPTADEPAITQKTVKVGEGVEVSYPTTTPLAATYLYSSVAQLSLAGAALFLM